MKKIANRDARCYVESLTVFKGNNIFSEWRSDNVYVVYSYGHHFPMYANVSGKWYGNSEKFSCTTSKHQTQARPIGVEIEYVTTEQLRDITEIARCKNCGGTYNSNTRKIEHHPWC